LENEYGLVAVKRITDGEGRESNKLKSGVKSKWHYFPYLGGTTAELRNSNNHEYKKTISDLDVLIDSLQDGKVEIIIVGDFNTDFIKMHERADDLSDLLAKYSLTSADINQVQHFDYTYFKFIENRFQSSWLDHAFLNDLIAKVNDCSINTSINNMGDHNAFSLN
jgi:nickel-dependent lactate racemase